MIKDFDMIDNIKKVVLYLRLSKEDIDKPTKDSISESIKNQEHMLKDEVRKHSNWQIVGVYCDEDFSGAGTYRPAFEEMINLCKEGKVDIVLCKSQSRFSRDMEVIEKYLHNKFLEWNIRFVSLVDNADTENMGNKKSRQINALVNEWFLEDLSNNIKATFRTKWTSGECTSAFAKYGLIKDPKNKNHLLIDPIASEVLKKIASMFLKGYGQDKIASILESMKIPSPYEYKLMNGSKLKLPNNNCDKKTISKTGTYIVRVSLYNKYKQILKNINGIFIFGTDDLKKYNNKFEISVRTFNSDLLLYYTTCNLSNDIDSYDFNNYNIWNKLEVNDIIPKNLSYIACYIKTLDRLIETSFELEVTLLENKEHNIYKLFTYSRQDNSININFDYKIRKKYKWSGRVIYNMLKDEIYNGTLIQGKTKRISYKNHKCIKTNKDSWISSKCALEKIFDDDTWMAIKKKMKEVSRSGKNGERHIFSGKVYCMVCGNILCKNSSSKNNKKVEYLLCSDKKNNWSNCDNKRSIRISELEDCILKSINDLIDKYYDLSILKILLKDSIFKYIFNDKLQSLNKEKSNIQTIIKKKRDIIMKLYDDYANEIIDKIDFISLKSKYKEDINKLNERLLVIEKELLSINYKKNNLDNKEDILLKYSYIDKLIPELIDEFIDKIIIGKYNSKTNTREIKIIWNF